MKQTTALEAALLWNGSPIQVDALRRARLSVRLRAFLVFTFALGPLELWLMAGLAWLLPSLGTAMAIALSAAGLGLAIYFVLDIDGWRQILTRSLGLLRKGEAVTIGESGEAAFFVPSDSLGVDEYPLVVPFRGGWALNFANPGVTGELLIDEVVHSLAEARQRGLLVGDLLPMRTRLRCRLRFGQFFMLFTTVPVPARPNRGFFGQMDLQELAYMAASLIIHMGLLVLFVHLQPEDDIQIRRRPNASMARLISVESIRENEDKEEAVVDQPLPEPVVLDEPVPTLDALTFAPSPTEKLLPTDVADVSTRRAPGTVRDMDPTTARQHSSRQAKSASEQLIPQQMLAKITGQNLLVRPSARSGVRVIGGGHDGPGAPFAADLQPGAGPASGSSYAGLDLGGTHGLDRPGKPGSPRGAGPQVADIGKEPRRGLRRIPKFTEKKQGMVSTAGPLTVSGGSLTKGILKKHILRQRGGVVACYRKEIQKNPNLAGKVVVKFTVTPTGRVANPGIKSSTLRSPPIESCIVRRLALWRFPSPKDAGAVRVTYPFLFRAR